MTATVHSLAHLVMHSMFLLTSLRVCFSEQPASQRMHTSSRRLGGMASGLDAQDQASLVSGASMRKAPFSQQVLEAGDDEADDIAAPRPGSYKQLPGVSGKSLSTSRYSPQHLPHAFVMFLFLMECELSILA